MSLLTEEETHQIALDNGGNTGSTEAAARAQLVRSINEIRALYDKPDTYGDFGLAVYVWLEAAKKEIKKV